VVLDEVGDMPPATQAKVLRLLQDQAFERVGGNETIRTDVRLIAATNRDLESLASEGKYRPDLLYRLGVFTIHLPPLRERGDDHPLLVQHDMRRFNRQLGRAVREITPEAMRRLGEYSWPGNVRELQSVLKRAILRSTGPVLVAEFLPELGPRKVAGAVEAWIERRLEAGGGDVYQEVHQHVDRYLLARVLRLTEGNQLQAVRILGIAPRTLRLKLRELGLSITRSVEGGQDDPA
jgi:DNA-binding NtrC family response regulator